MVDNTINQDDVLIFWDWFYKNINSLENGDKDVINQLDQKIVSLGDFAWEIGPGKVERNSFVISPNGRKDLLTLTKQIIKVAPNCEGWEFRYAKPPKDWDLIFNIQNSHGRPIEINAKNWEYVLFEFPDRTFDIVIKAPSLIDLEDNEKTYCAEIVLDGILGEEKHIELIENIEIVNEFDEDLNGRKSSIKSINSHINSLK
jgi:hypothetical protein